MIKSLALVLLMAVVVCGGASAARMENAYVAVDQDLGYDPYLGAMACYVRVPLMPGDIIEVEATTENPADFISGDDAFGNLYIIGNGVIDNLQGPAFSYRIFEDESLANSDSYYMEKQIDRNSFVMAVCGRGGDHNAVSGHMRIVVHSRYTAADHAKEDEMRTDMAIENQKIWKNKFEKPPY